MITGTDTVSGVSTLRPVARLPALPNEKRALEECNPVLMSTARLDGEVLVFTDDDQWNKVFRDGFFLLQTPEEIDLSPGDDFVREFYCPKNHGGVDYRDVKFNEQYQGYFDRPFDQWENFYVERANWGSIPKRVSHLGSELADLGIIVLKNVLRRLDIPECHWGAITGGLTAGGGHRMLAFNHFRSEKTARGCKMHRDSGWVTVLRSYEPGLLALIDGQLRAINPRDGYLIINFGSSIEVLTNALDTSVNANVHGVAQTVGREPGADRHSFTMFLDSSLDGTIYQMNGHTPQAIQSVAAFAEQEVARTYDSDDDYV
jgi:hypothetical protein